jgi:hypothetical protein
VPFRFKEYCVLSNQCEPVVGLSYHYLPEERALEIMSNCGGDLQKVTKYFYDAPLSKMLRHSSISSYTRHLVS